MKTIITILFSLFVFNVFSQLYINPMGTTYIGNLVSTGSVTVGTDLTVTGNSLIELPHCFYSLRDTNGVTLSLDRWVWKSFTGLVEKEAHQFGRTTGDTIKYQGTREAHNNLNVHVNGTTSNANDDVWIRILNVRTGEIFYGMALSGGSNNYSEWLIIAYDITAHANDKYVIQARNKTNGNDLVIYSMQIDFSTRHFE